MFDNLLEVHNSLVHLGFKMRRLIFYAFDQWVPGALEPRLEGRRAVQLGAIRCR